MSDETTARKDAHLDLCATGDVEPKENRTLLECVQLVHCALPELSVDEVQLETQLFGKKLRFPLMITGMTGGTPRAGEVNRELARLAEAHQIAFGVGSQRAMSESPARAESYRVRDVAPNVTLLGNIGLTQALALGVDGVLRLMDAISADAMAVHLNPAQELTQPEGDRDFRGGLGLIAEVARRLGERLLVKETGCGISPSVAARLFEVGVKNVDVSGLGGTSWVRVEQLRAGGVDAEIGATFSGWGIPTAAALASVRRIAGPAVKVVASGGLRTGLDAARALALGADAAGFALPIFRAQQQGGYEGADRALQAIEGGLVRALVLTGSRNVAELRKRPRVVTGELKDWLASL
jgi:isopentenyl-diphosphate delta-isomerase